jgi:hypothetical protein
VSRKTAKPAKDALAGISFDPGETASIEDRTIARFGPLPWGTTVALPDDVRAALVDLMAKALETGEAVTIEAAIAAGVMPAPYETGNFY